MRHFFAMTLLCAFAAGQISAPVIGYVRDLAGDLRPVSGVSGAFVLGDAVESGVTSARFLGATGCAWTEQEVISLHNGVRTEETAHCPEPASSVRIEGDEVVIDATGERLRLPDGATALEQMAEHWFVLRGPKALYALHAKPGAAAIYQLPEAAR